MTDTIFALATAPGRAAVAVVRLSGPNSRAMLHAVGGRALKSRTAALRTLTNAQGETLDRALVMWFPGPASYTGEDCGELLLHGGAAVVDGVMATLAELGGGSRSLESSRGGLSKTASLTSTRPRRWPTSSTLKASPRPGRRWRSSAAPWVIATGRGDAR